MTQRATDTTSNLPAVPVVQINLKDNVNLSRQDVEDRIHKIGQQFKNDALAAANVYCRRQIRQRI